MATEAQLRATAKYQKEKMRSFGMKFSEREYDILDFIKSKPNASGFVKGLIREAMERERGDCAKVDKDTGRV